MSRSARDEFLHHLAYVVFARKWLIIGTFLASFFLVVFAALLITPHWNAKARLVAKQTLSPDSSTYPNPLRPARQQGADTYAQHLMSMMTGKQMAYRVVKEFGLDERMRRQSEEPQVLREKVKAGIGKSIGAVMSLISGGEHKPDWVDRAAKKFYDGFFSWVSAKAVQETDVVELTVSGQTPELANQILEFMIQTLRDMVARSAAASGRQTVESYEKELESVGNDLRTAQKALADFSEANGGMVLSADAANKTEKLVSLESDRSHLLAEKSVLASQRDLSQSPEAILSNAFFVSSETVAANSIVQQLSESLHSRRVELAAMRKEVTEANPSFIAASTQIKQMERELHDEIDNILRTIDANLQSREQEIRQLKAEMVLISSKDQEFSRLSMEVESLKRAHMDLKANISSIKTIAESGLAGIAIDVLDTAPVSSSASTDMPAWVITIVIALFFSSGMCVVLPLFIEYWRDPIRGPGDLLARGITPLASIPNFKKKDFKEVRK